ncbi:MAG: heavy metal-associated domain-containing protein [Gammaproteobacteria bacterium]
MMELLGNYAFNTLMEQLLPKWSFPKLFAVALLLSSPSGFANDYVVHVHGMVCSFCAQGVTKKISKLPFIDRSKYTKGVKVEIENQKVTVAVKPDERLDVPALFKAIKSGGYDPVDVWTVGATGEIDELVDY